MKVIMQTLYWLPLEKESIFTGPCSRRLAIRLQGPNIKIKTSEFPLLCDKAKH